MGSFHNITNIKYVSCPWINISLFCENWGQLYKTFRSVIYKCSYFNISNNSYTCKGFIKLTPVFNVIWSSSLKYAGGVKKNKTVERDVLLLATWLLIPILQLKGQRFLPD